MSQAYYTAHIGAFYRRCNRLSGLLERPDKVCFYERHAGCATLNIQHYSPFVKPYRSRSVTTLGRATPALSSIRSTLLRRLGCTHLSALPTIECNTTRRRIKGRYVNNVVCFRACSIRCRAMSTYPSSSSIPTKLRPSFTHATPVEPLPMNGSRTVPPVGVAVSLHR